jgi:hypothetical protein
MHSVLSNVPNERQFSSQVSSAAMIEIERWRLMFCTVWLEMTWLNDSVRNVLKTVGYV